MVPIPVEFRQLCKWAPRTPAEGLQAPYTASKLFDVSKNWSDAIHNKKPYRPPPPPRRWSRVIGAGAMLALTAVALAVLGRPYLSGIFPSNSPTLTSTQLTVVSSATHPELTETQPASSTPSAIATTATVTQTPTASFTIAPAISPSPGTLTAPILLFDNKFVLDPKKSCWDNKTDIPGGLMRLEGFSRRDVDKYWRFGVEKNRTPEEYIQTNFTEQCLDAAAVQAISMDVSILRLEEKREFGFFIEYANGTRREYTIWLERVDNVDRMYLRVRDGATVNDYEQLIINNLIADRRSYLHPFYQFSLQLFFEVNNHGLSIPYLREGALKEPVSVEQIDPKGMKLIDQAVLPSVAAVQRIGLIGYGGETQVAIWPLAFYGE